MRRLLLPCVLTIALAACSSAASGPGGSPDASADVTTACDPSACLASGLTVVIGAATYVVSPCAAVTRDDFNKGTNQTEHCSAAIAACGDASVESVNAALADPEVVALSRTGAELIDPTFGSSPADIMQIGIRDADGGTGPFINVRASCLGGGTCPPNAPASVVRLAHALSAIAAGCVVK